MPDFKKIILSRTDNIGDVLLTLPLAGFLKQKFPDVIIYFIGKTYTAPLLKACIHIDFVLDREEVIANPSLLNDIKADVIVHVFPDKKIAAMAFAVGIPMRIGTSHRIFNWLYCNRMINLSRKNSNLHEILLNFKLLRPLVSIPPDKLEEVQHFYGFSNIEKLNAENLLLINNGNVKIILHPKSKGSAREWPIQHYIKLIALAPAERYEFYITGTENEGKTIRETAPEIFNPSNVHDLTGRLTLAQLISFIQFCDGLVACSTGPLHIAAALGKHAVGIYPPMRPIHPGRWAPVGVNARTLVLNKRCDDCRKTSRCHCIELISPHEVVQEMLKING
jgi:heptosyltransferase-3